MIGASRWGRRQKRFSLSCAHVPMCGAVMWRRFVRWKQTSAPSSESASSEEIRASRSSRGRAKRTRSSQSTAIVPYVWSAMLQTIAPELRRVNPGQLDTPARSVQTFAAMPFDLRSKTLGWVGTGRMGYALATRLLEAGCDLAAYNRTRANAEPLAEAGAAVVDAPVDLA